MSCVGAGKRPSSPTDTAVPIARLRQRTVMAPSADRAGPLGLDDAEFGRAAVCAVFDNDGDVDILLLHEGATLWENESRGANFVLIQLT